MRRAGCLFVGAASGTAFGDYVAGSNHVLPTGGAARFASVLSPRTFRRTMAEVRVARIGGRLARAGAAIARAEGFVAHAESMEARIRDNGRDELRRNARRASVTRRTKETGVELTLRLDGTGEGARDTGVGFLDHMLDLLARHGRLDLDVRGARATSRRARTTPSRTSGICLGQALDGALGDRSGIAPLRRRDRADGRGARARARSTSRAGRTARSRPSCRPATIAASSTS